MMWIVGLLFIGLACLLRDWYGWAAMLWLTALSMMGLRYVASLKGRQQEDNPRRRGKRKKQEKEVPTIIVDMHNECMYKVEPEEGRHG